MIKYPNKGSRRGPNRNPYYSSSRDVNNYAQQGRRLSPYNSEQKNNFSTGTIAVLAGVLILVGLGAFFYLGIKGPTDY